MSLSEIETPFPLPLYKYADVCLHTLVTCLSICLTHWQLYTGNRILGVASFCYRCCSSISSTASRRSLSTTCSISLGPPSWETCVYTLSLQPSAFTQRTVLSTDCIFMGLGSERSESKHLIAMMLLNEASRLQDHFIQPSLSQQFLAQPNSPSRTSVSSSPHPSERASSPGPPNMPYEVNRVQDALARFVKSIPNCYMDPSQKVYVLHSLFSPTLLSTRLSLTDQ